MNVGTERFDDIPQAMRDAKRWLLWKLVPHAMRGKKPRKIPYYANGTPRNGVLDTPADIANLCTFTTACNVLASGQYTGLGFALGPDGSGNYWQGVDLDGLQGRPDLHIIRDDLPGYTEASPSGNGVHAIGYGKRFESLGANDTGIEAYCERRYFTVTGEEAGVGSISDISAFVEIVLRPKHSPVPVAPIHSAEVISFPHPDVEVTPETVRDLRSALAFLKADDYDTWVAMGHRLRTIGDVGRGLWMEWSQQSDKYDPQAAAKAWNSFRPHRTGHLAVFSEAKKCGWVNPRSNLASYIGTQPATSNDQDPPPDDATSTKTATFNYAALPPPPEELASLPGTLGKLQRFIFRTMTYPSQASAGFTALAVMSQFAMPLIGIRSKWGLGFNEQFLILAPTGTGKESLRRPFRTFAEAIANNPPPDAGDLAFTNMAHITNNMPASAQGLHNKLEDCRSLVILADEFGEWLAGAAREGHKQFAMSYLMQAYSSAYGDIDVPAVSTRTPYKPYSRVSNPRVLLFATSTAERFMETVTCSQADSGGLNRFVTFIEDAPNLVKSYERLGPSDYAIPDDLIVDLQWIAGLPEQLIPLSDAAWELHDTYDREVVEKIKREDYRLAGRLNEQAIKTAGLLALANRRLFIDASDLKAAYAIRIGLYRRVASMMEADGAVSTASDTGKAEEQVISALRQNKKLYLSKIKYVSRRFAALEVNDRAAVIRSLVAEGTALVVGKMLVLAGEQV
jgi:hypothetical protein